MHDNSAFELFIREHQDLVFSTAARLLRNQADAEDVAQEVFLRAYKDFGMLNSNPAAGAWLRRVARNLCLNHLTRYRSRWTLFSDFFRHQDDTAAEEIIPHFANDSSPSETSDDQEMVQVALLTLPAKQRVPLVLFHYEEMSYEEIASALKTTLSQVKTDIHRGREALRDKILRFRRQSDKGMPNMPGRHWENPTEPLSERAIPDQHQSATRSQPAFGIL